MSDITPYPVLDGPDRPISVRVPQLETRRERRARSLAAVAELAATHTSSPELAVEALPQPTEVVFSDEVPVTLHRRLIALSSTNPATGENPLPVQ